LSPILVRPVREQLEHDRVIRLLQAKLKRKYDVVANVGEEQTAAVRIGAGQMFPDLVLSSLDKARRLEGIVEVETAESVNHLEAMAQWAHFGRARARRSMARPAAAVDIARRLCAENDVAVAEVWSYHTIADQTRFTPGTATTRRPSRSPPSRARRSRRRRRAPPAAPARKKKPAPKSPKSKRK
jgi:hypothetical protein